MVTRHHAHRGQGRLLCVKEPAKEAVVAGSKWNRDLDVAHPTHTRKGRRQFADLRHINVKGDRHPIVNR